MDKTYQTYLEVHVTCVIYCCIYLYVHFETTHFFQLWILKLYFYHIMQKWLHSRVCMTCLHMKNMQNVISYFNIWIIKAICVEISISSTYLINYTCIREELMNIQRWETEVVSSLQGWEFVWECICGCSALHTDSN